MIKKDSPHVARGTAGAPRTSTGRARSAARVAASPRLPVPFLATAPPLPSAVAVSAPGLGEVDGRGAVFVLPVVSEAAGRHVHGIDQQRGVIRGCRVPLVRCVPANGRPRDAP